MDHLMLLIAPWAAFLLAAVSPGPNMLAVMERAFGGGKTPAIGVAVGISIGSLLWSMSALFGVQVLLEKYLFLIPVVGFIGGAYLLYVGIGRLSALKSESVAPNVVPAEEVAIGKSILHGLLVVISNPKVAVFWISMATVIAKMKLDNSLIITFSIICALTALTVYTVEAIAFSKANLRVWYFSNKYVVDLLFSMLFIGIGYI